MPNFIHQSHCPRRCHRPDGVALVVTLSMLAIVALLAIAFVLTARTEVKSGSAYNDQAVAKSLAKMAVDRAAMEIYRQNKGNVISGGEVATTYTNNAMQSVILIYSTNDFTKLDNYTTDTSLLNFGYDGTGTIPAPYRWPNSITHPFDGYDYVDRDGQPGRSTVEPYWIAVRDNNGVLRGRFAYVALGNLIDLNAIGNINIWDSHATATPGVNAFYMRPADTNFGYGYIGNSNSISTRGLCPDISLPKFLLKIGYNSATVNTSAYCLVAYRYGWPSPTTFGAPWLYNPATKVYPGGIAATDPNGDGVNHNPTDYRVYPSLLTGNNLITALSQIWTIPIDTAATVGWDPHYGNGLTGNPYTPDPAYTNLSSYASVGLSADPNLVGTYVGSRVNLNAMTNGTVFTDKILSNSVMQLTNVLWKFPQFTNNYNNNLSQVTNKILQIALNLIDFHTTNRYPSVFTNGVGANATVLTGIKPTPYINQIYIRYDTTFFRSTNVGGANAGKTNYWFSTSVAVTNELWNPYPATFPDTNNLVVTNITIISTNTTAKSYTNSWTASCIFTSPVRGYTVTGVPPAINTNVYRTTLGLSNVMAIGYYSNATPGVVPGTIIITNIFVTAKLYGLTNVNYLAYQSSNLIQQIAVSVTNVLTNAWPTYATWASPAPWSPIGIGPAPGTTNTASTNVILNLEADDPRMGILYTQQLNTANNYNLGAMNATCFPNEVNIYQKNNPNYYLDTGPREGTNSFFVKTNVFPKAGAILTNAYVSVGEIGYVHRGEPWATIRLQPATNYATLLPATNWPYGEGKLLDYFRVNNLMDVAGRINLNSDTNGPAWIYAAGANANQSPALFALFSGITNSWYTNSLYAKTNAVWTATIDGGTDDKITAIIKEIGDYRANMTNGAVNFTGQNNLMTYVGELCAISNLTTYTDDRGLTGIQQIPYTDDANREALIRAVANLATTFEGGGTSTILAWGQVIKGGDTTSSNGVPGQTVRIQATFQVVNGKIQMTSYQYIP